MRQSWKTIILKLEENQFKRWPFVCPQPDDSYDQEFDLLTRPEAKRLLAKGKRIIERLGI